VTADPWPIGDAGDDYVTRLPGGAVLLSSELARFDVARALAAVERAAQANGAGLPPRLQHLAAVLRDSLSGSPVSAVGHADDRSDAGPAPWGASQLVDAATAAGLLGTTPRTVRRMLEQGRLAGHKRAGTWEVDRCDVQRVLDDRKGAA
jgi:hypothetical protein